MKITKEEIKPIVHPPFNVILEMTEQEAEWLLCIVGKITGGGKAREFFDDLFTNLNKILVNKRNNISQLATGNINICKELSK